MFDLNGFCIYILQIDLVKMDIELPSVDDNTNINDARFPNDFQGVSFSNYNKTAVRKHLIENMMNSRIEPACYWSSELICAGHFMDLWEIILHFIGKHIHIGNPKIVIYVEKRFLLFRNLMETEQFTSEMQLRNHPTIRQMFAEIICTLTISKRKHSFETIKIKRETEFDMTNMTDRLKATSAEYATNILQSDDPKELFICINELSYHLSKDSLSVVNACYWIEWLIEFDLICKKKKQAVSCETRTDVQVENKHKNNIIWIVWDAIMKYGDELEDPFISQLLLSLRNIFCIKYTPATNKKRRYLLYYAVTLVVETIPTDIPLMANKTLVVDIMQRINTIYKQIKKKEQKPTANYLFKNLEKEVNLEKSMRRMEMMNSIDITHK